VIGIEIRFLAGRYHGNAWHHDHNEGVPEWPPSPWRVLRALVAAGCSEGLPSAPIEALLRKLSALPTYKLPAAVEAHTRHYVPDTGDANHKRAKLFDSFVAVDGGASNPAALTMSWRVDLDGEETELLRRLCRRVPYLGRAESWVELAVVTGDAGIQDCWPDEESLAHQTANLLTIDVDRIESLMSAPLAPKGPVVPRQLWEVLTFTGQRFRSEGWSDVPGTRLARYVFRDAPFRRAVVSASARRPSQLPTVARFAIRSAVLPPLREALGLGERLRAAVMSQSKAVSGDARPVFSGHGDPSRGHLHAMYLASSEGEGNESRGLVDHFTVVARGGFEADDVIALQKLRRLWGKGGHDLELILIGLGQAGDFGGALQPFAPVLARSAEWTTVTPFVPTRHPKTVRGIQVDTVVDQLRRACVQFLGEAPTQISILPDRTPWQRFRRHRYEGGGSKGPDRAYGVRLRFDRPIQGPIALGYGAHFGLGLFGAVRA